MYTIRTEDGVALPTTNSEEVRRKESAKVGKKKKKATTAAPRWYGLGKWYRKTGSSFDHAITKSIFHL